MPVFTQAGTGKFDFWLLDGQPNFAVIPADTIEGVSLDLPIRLQQGDRSFGANHILEKHGHWVRKVERQNCVGTLLHRKLSQYGKMHTEEKGKHVLAMHVSPSSLIILRRPNNKDFFTVVTMYFRQGNVEGEELCRYLGEWAISPCPTPRW